MDIEILRGEIERLFSLDELTALSRELLDLDPDQIGGTQGKASFARALTERCSQIEALDALVDAVVGSRADVDPRLRDLSLRGFSVDELLPPETFIGPFIVHRRIGEGGVGVVYGAEVDGQPVVLKVLRREAARDARALHRFLTLTRLLSRIVHPSLPRSLSVGRLPESGCYYVAYEDVGGEPLSARLARDGALPVHEARSVARAVLEALAALHDRGIAHGNLKLENVIVPRGSRSAPAIVVDAGVDRLRQRTRSQNGHTPYLYVLGSPKTTAPEQIRGGAAHPRADVYAFGAVLYELVTGKPPFAAATAVDAAVAHLSQAPRAPSEVARPGSVGRELDRFVLSLLAKEPTARPRDARAVLEAFDLLERVASAIGSGAIAEEELAARIDELLASPEDDAAALRLESALDEGGEPSRVAGAFVSAAAQVAARAGDAFAAESERALLYRAARAYERANDLESAEGVYGRIVARDAADDIAQSALLQVRRVLGKHEEVIEMLLAQSDVAASGPEKARLMAEIGRIYAYELEDKSQALVAHVQAFCEDPEVSAYADEVERLAGSDPKRWAEATSLCAAATGGDPSGEPRTALLERLGVWYSEKMGRADLAASCFQAILGYNPNHDGALAGLAAVYQRAQRWPDLAAVFVQRAAAASPTLARAFVIEAAELFEHRLGDLSRARELYRNVLDEDPTHAAAGEGLCRILEQTGEFLPLVHALEQRAELAHGEGRAVILGRIAEIFEDQLDDLREAARRYEALLDEDEQNALALKGLDRVYNRTGRYRDLLGILERQIHAAATPRQTITLYERIASIYEDEFIDHERAAEACEAIVAIDPNMEEPFTALARHYRTLDRWEEVASTYERHLRAARDDRRKIELCLALGKVLLEQIGSPARAVEAYEKALALDPNQPVALEALAKVRAGAGNATLAVRAVDALAQQAATPEAKVEQWMRAGKLLEEGGDLDGAIQRFEAALDVLPMHAGAMEALGSAYTARGDAGAAIELISRQIDVSESPLVKARLLAETAQLARARLRDDARASAAATQAHRLDPTNIEALVVLGDLAFDEGRFLEAAAHYELPAHRAEKLGRADATRVLVRYVDALSKTGSTERALAPMDQLLEIAPGDSDALSRVARVTFEHGEPKRAYELYRDLLSRFRESLPGREEAEALYRLGESARRAGFAEIAVGPLAEAADLDPAAPEPLASLAKLYEAAGDWESVAEMKGRRLDVAEGEERHTLLLEIGEICAGRLVDRTRAAKSYIAALEDRPDDRNILTKLMQLYSEEKDWGKLVEVVLKLSDFVEDKKQKAKYLHTAAKVSARQLGEIEVALRHYDRALELDPTLDRALEEAIELRGQGGDYRGVETLLKVKLEHANRSNDREKMLATLDELGALYHGKLGWLGAAVDAYEAAQALDPEDDRRADALAALYASDPIQYLDKAVRAERAILRRNPDRPDAYKLLRKLYTETKRADAAWCMCQALSLLNLAEPDEERFFRRMRSDAPAAARAELGQDDFQHLLAHDGADPTLMAMFLLLEPAIVEARARPLEQLGYDPADAIELEASPHPMAQTLLWAASVLGMSPPLTFENVNDPGGLSFLHAPEPAIVVGRSGLQAQIAPQAGAFIVARHLAFYRPGLYVRQLVPTGTGLKAWLFAAVKMISAQFPVPADLEGPIHENMAALQRSIRGPTRERLSSLVAKLLSSGSLDLKAWVASVDLTADRVGFLLAHDLEVAGELIKASGNDSSALPVKERLRELILFATSEEYFALRAKLGLAIDS